MTDKRKDSVRITIVLPNELNQKLREIQSKLIPNFTKSVSFSAVLSESAEVGIKNIGQIKGNLLERYND
jgi:hypothetical protein